jgi:DnaJ-class molecular chaperone
MMNRTTAFGAHLSAKKHVREKMANKIAARMHDWVAANYIETRPCNQCQGSGKGVFFKCKACGGRGVHPVVTCPKCGGKGKGLLLTCGLCGGSGKAVGWKALMRHFQLA